MYNSLIKYNRTTLVLLTTSLSIVATLFVVFIGYKLMGVKVRETEIFIGIIAPLLIASTVTWYLYGLIKKLKALEEKLRDSISKEKEDIYLATIQGAQHITNNLLNELQLVEFEIKKHPDFDKEVANLFRGMLDEAKNLIINLSSVKHIDATEIKDSVHPGKIKKQ